MTIGFIGLGVMGKPMAINLLKAGKSVIAYDISTEAINVAVEHGAIKGDSVADVVASSEIVITMLPNSPQVKEVIFMSEGILSNGKKGSIVIDMSSIAPAVSREVGYALMSKGIGFLDAPVSGGEPKAIEGTLSIMVGGDKAILAKVQYILEILGDSIVHCGDVGAGNTVKLVNQVVVAANIAALAEALNLGEAAGVESQVIINAIRGGLAGSTVMEAKAPMMIQRSFNPGFRINLHIKDLQNALDTGHLKGSHLPITALVMEMLQNVRAHGGGDLDHSALWKFYEGLN